MGKIWSQSYARKSLLGDDSMNPSIAARSLLDRAFGPSRVAYAIRRAKKRRRSFHRGNPLPALLVAGGGLLGKLGGRFKAPSEKRAARVAPQLVSAAVAGNLTAAKTILDRQTIAGIKKERDVWIAAAQQLPANIVAAVAKYKNQIPGVDNSSPEAAAATALARPFGGTGAAPVGAPTGTAAFLNQFTPGNVVQIARAVTPKRRSSRARYPTYIDRYGRQRYSTKPPGSQLRLPAGASVAAGTPYSFFRGAVGAGGVGVTAAQLGVAAAAGAAAYFGTQAILKYFGGRAVKKEEAGVQLALAARDARKEYALTHGLRGAAPSYGVPASVIREIGAGMKQQLAELGYNEQGVRTRSGTEEFLSTYGE